MFVNKRTKKQGGCEVFSHPPCGRLGYFIILSLMVSGFCSLLCFFATINFIINIVITADIIDGIIEYITKLVSGIRQQFSGRSGIESQLPNDSIKKK